MVQIEGNNLLLKSRFWSSLIDGTYFQEPAGSSSLRYQEAKAFPRPEYADMLRKDPRKIGMPPTP
jgi:hypothetical protein